MLTSGDDYPIHQIPEPIAYTTGERNFYDRYFFNGYSRDFSVFFAVALGVYPQVGVMDASVSIIRDGVQRNLRASRSAAILDRMATRVGPIEVEVLQPLRSLRVRVSSREHGIDADLVFDARAAAVEEPRYTRRAGARLLMDLTRLTQNGTWRGHLGFDGTRVDVDGRTFWGTRDRSWGVRSIGEPDLQPVPGAERQFYWLWAPLNFDDRVTLFHRNDDGDGRPWNRFAAVLPLDLDGRAQTFAQPTSRIRLHEASRHAAAARIELGPATEAPDNGATGVGGATPVAIELVPRFEFYMSGIGYGHPQWGHGRHRGELSVGFDSERLADADRNDPLHLHVQAVCEARLELADGSERRGQGVLEQLIFGRHTPSGLNG
jgi:hypothetical protein